MQKRQESTKNVKKRTVGGAAPKKGNGGAAKSKKSNPAGKREDFLDFQPKKQTPSKAQVHNKKKKEYQNGGSKKSAPVRPAREFAAMDAVVAFTGLLVLVVAVLTTGIYLSSAEVAKQKEAIAAVGKKLEQVGTAGEEILSAVARQREEAEDARDVSEAAPMEYEEKELETDMDLALKMTSVEKDLKIKFTNRETGKLVGNQAFTVSISGPVSKAA